MKRTPTSRLRMYGCGADMNRRSQGTMKILLVVNMVCHCQAGFVSCSVGSLDTLHDRLMGSLMAVMAQPQ